MPNVQFVCPHCEKSSEIQVASVTRSRACPNCGYNVLLQVAAKGTKTTRKALLVSVAHDGEDVEPDHIPGHRQPAYLPQPLEGDVLERMRFDPEINSVRKQIVGGLFVLGLAMAGAVIWHFVPTRPEPTFAADIGTKNSAVGSMSPSVPTAPVAPAIRPSSSLKPNVIGVRRDEVAKPAGKLVFDANGPRVAAGRVAVEKEELVRKVLSAFLAAESVDSMLTTIAFRSAVEPTLREYYLNHPLVPVRPIEITPTEDPLLPAGAVAMQIKISSGRRIQANVLTIDDRHVGVDWASFVGLSEIEWAQFLTSKPMNAATFRVYAEAGELYANDFADAAKLRCVKITSPSDPSQTPFFAYVDRSSPMDKTMESLLRGRTSPVAVSLRLKFPRDVVADNQGWIESVVSSCWVISPESKTAQVTK